MIDLLKEGLDRNSHGIPESEPSFIKNSSPGRSNKSLQRVLKHDFRIRIYRLEIKTLKG